ncbi:MAG: permease [Chloroflexi bacterium]|nr:permease [Chloroflexota bacterium]MBK6711033.1 permease [Chloroflexota bacterium]
MDVETANQAGPELETAVSAKRATPRFLIGLVVLTAVIFALARFTTGPIHDRFQTFTTIFLGIFIEAVPFLLAGSIVSGLIEIFIDRDWLARWVPRRAAAAALTGALMGFAFPVCECGVVPVTRRLYHKGLPLSVGVAFLLAAPVVNPIVILSTYAAFGWGPVLIGRLVFSVLIAFIAGLLFNLAAPEEALLPTTQADEACRVVDERQGTGYGRFWQALAIGGDDFMDMARYLIAGSMMAAAMQTLIPQSTLLALGSGPIISVIIMMALAFVLSICSTVDAFLALSFVNSFTTGSILAFLVFGPMVDIKSSLMFLGVFRKRAVLYLILLPMALSLLMGVAINSLIVQ